jgi:hypothetical protein
VARARKKVCCTKICEKHAKRILVDKHHILFSTCPFLTSVFLFEIKGLISDCQTIKSKDNVMQCVRQLHHDYIRLQGHAASKQQASFKGLIKESLAHQTTDILTSSA